MFIDHLNKHKQSFTLSGYCGNIQTNYNVSNNMLMMHFKIMFE